MNLPSRSIVKTGGGADLAFALVVLASYFAIFSTASSATVANLVLMIVLGITYIGIGIYGYRYCANSTRLSFQLAYFAVQIPLGGLIIYLGRSSSFNSMLLLPLAGHSVILLPQIWMLTANTLLLASYVLSSWFISGGWGLVWAGLPTFLAGQTFIAFYTQMAVNEENARSEVERLINQLAQANQRLREYAQQVEELATTKERNRLAREIHDGLGHSLTTIHMQIQAARAIMPQDTPRSAEILGKAQNMARAALQDVRHSVASLRSATGENLPLHQRIQKLLDNSELAQVETEFKIIGQPRHLSVPAELTLYRAIQEGLNNACKHAQASKIWIKLDFSMSDRVHLTIIDDGIGSDDTSGGFGLISLQERVNLLNGKVNVSSTHGSGFTLEIELPQPPPLHQEAFQ